DTWCGHYADAGVCCVNPTAVEIGVVADESVRLVECVTKSGYADCCCRVEIFHDGAWGTVCDDYFDYKEAAVVCRQMGLTGGVSFWNFGGGFGHIWLDSLNCGGSEATLGECPHDDWGDHDCSHYEDAGES
ncbi:SRCR-like domain-containing protein, partial [Baffinella frigidus]